MNVDPHVATHDACRQCRLGESAAATEDVAIDRRRTRGTNEDIRVVVACRSIVCRGNGDRTGLLK